jgi:hypothetical protein
VRSPLRELAASQFGAFSTKQAMLCYTRAELRAHVRSGRWRRVFTGSYRRADSEPDARLRLAAAALSIGRPVAACLHTAAELHGFGVLDDAVTHVAVDPGAPCLHRDGLWPRQLLLGPADLTLLWCGASATTADRTAVDLSRTLPRVDVLPVLDAALETGKCTPGSLAAELTRHVGMPGVRQARGLVPLARTGPDSPQESRMRLLCHDAGLPEPTVQLPVLDARGRDHRWIDLGWEEAKVGLEYDGEEAHGADRRHSDRRRHNVLGDGGWAMFYATDQDIRHPRTLMAQLDRAITRRSRGKGRSQ